MVGWLLAISSTFVRLRLIGREGLIEVGEGEREVSVMLLLLLLLFNMYKLVDLEGFESHGELEADVF